ncbi:hypothetical protein [Fangia hongkongensis]|uniref:hypothetical protein n=1 Tax=Fangia hongkongensis TaxID=270495 RepID=UPI0003612154|nr:hypothetical protein [Fangia hongkongensis]MBK2123927.1 hypothetical protein [Fangia hongkongensis]
MKNLINKLVIISLSAFAVGAMSPAFAHDNDFLPNTNPTYYHSVSQDHGGSASVNAERSI